MTTINRYVAATTLGLAVLAAATPGFAQRGEQQGVNAARERAIRECNAQVTGMSQYTWGDHQITQYRSCMNQHGESE
jgi:hypothetical protein